jgi:predicted helicase
VAVSTSLSTPTPKTAPTAARTFTDWALEEFRSQYHDPSITKWDIFHYIYAVLHHPEYRERYAANPAANSPASRSPPPPL